MCKMSHNQLAVEAGQQIMSFSTVSLQDHAKFIILKHQKFRTQITSLSMMLLTLHDVRLLNLMSPFLISIL